MEGGRESVGSFVRAVASQRDGGIDGAALAAASPHQGEVEWGRPVVVKTALPIQRKKKKKKNTLFGMGSFAVLANCGVIRLIISPVCRLIT